MIQMLELMQSLDPRTELTAGLTLDQNGRRGFYAERSRPGQQFLRSRRTTLEAHSRYKAIQVRNPKHHCSIRASDATPFHHHRTPSGFSLVAPHLHHKAPKKTIEELVLQMDMNASTSVTFSSFATSLHTVFLPLELLVEIFLLSLPATNHAQAPQKRALALVCRFWNSIIESTPILWSRISIADPTSNLLIDVNGARIAEEGWIIGHCDGICCQFMQGLIRYSDRWRHVALQISCDKPHAPMVLKRPLPSLKSLELYSDVGGPLHYEFLQLLQKQNAPYLHEVVLDFIGLPSPNISFPPSLSNLAIYDIPNFAPRLIQVLSFLVACPSLTILHLCNVDIRVDDRLDDRANTPTVVELANLQELKLDCISSNVAEDLLGRVMAVLDDDAEVLWGGKRISTAVAIG
ncbi:hypothetical protein M407DRAFT_18161 [Tulasnella calospora MUT 4182]|uniref:F-box domain-containing protein n=1 Tax=Tulasnella calospora MUT 4182 TaxID=1051891 RepID=A0A0C3QW19_9AGAM|nr:hypothetical protein M407DRAFT_18161 [Tulasnella calospora MUT 4182]